MARYTKWERDHVLSFIPPDGKFKLLEYQAMVGTRIPLPLSLKAGLSVEDNGGKSAVQPGNRKAHSAQVASRSL